MASLDAPLLELLLPTLGRGQSLKGQDSQREEEEEKVCKPCHWSCLRNSKGSFLGGEMGLSVQSKQWEVSLSLYEIGTELTLGLCHGLRKSSDVKDWEVLSPAAGSLDWNHLESIKNHWCLPPPRPRQWFYSSGAWPGHQAFSKFPRWLMGSQGWKPVI